MGTYLIHLKWGYANFLEIIPAGELCSNRERLTDKENGR